jgi:hypothetical protein
MAPKTSSETATLFRDTFSSLAADLAGRGVLPVQTVVCMIVDDENVV